MKMNMLRITVVSMTQLGVRNQEKWCYAAAGMREFEYWLCQNMAVVVWCGTEYSEADNFLRHLLVHCWEKRLLAWGGSCI